VALLVANRGQTDRLSFFVQFTDATGAAADPTGAVSLAIYRSNPDGTLTLKTTLTPTKQASLLGWFGAFLDVADATVWPEGLYVARWAATVAGIDTATTEPFQIQAAALPASSAPLASSYCTAEQVRQTLNLLESAAAPTPAIVAEQAARAASVIDGALGLSYVVPFALPAPALVVTINAWLGAAYTLEYLEGQQGRRSKTAVDVEKRALNQLKALAEGASVLPGAALVTDPVGPASVRSTTEGTSPFFTFGASESPDLSEY